MTIYKITNNINGKVYIGQTRQNLSSRYAQHLQRANSGVNTQLYIAMRKYGTMNFTISVVEEIDDSIDNPKETLDEREKYWIDYYQSYGDNGYNSTLGGDVNPMDCEYSKHKHDAIMRSESVRKSISNSLKEYRKQHPFSEEHRKRLSQSAMGNHNFGTGDTRSIGVYCIDKNGERREFHSIKDATVWWFDTYKPFGDRYVLITLQRKIRASIDKKKKFDIDWFKIE